MLRQRTSFDDVRTDLAGDPFRNQIGMMLTGPGRTTVAIYAAVVMMPVLLFWGLVDRFLRKRSKRRGDPFRT